MIITFHTFAYNFEICVDHADIIQFHQVDAEYIKHHSLVRLKDSKTQQYCVSPDFNQDYVTKLTVARNGATQGIIIRESLEQVKKAIQRGNHAK
jgi:hypothetical protein